MRFGVIVYNLGKICLVLGAAIQLPLTFSFVTREEEFVALLISAFIMLFIGVAFMTVCRSYSHTSLRYRESFAIATFAWLLAAGLGALPYILSNTCSVPDAIFESMSGFTTTGASILPDLEAVPAGILIWRGLTHWLGGMGIVVLLVAMVSGNSAAKMYKAEAPGNALTEKLAPQSGDMAKILWITYVGMSVLLMGILMLCGMNFVDALCHTFGTVSTGGFSSRNASMSAFNDNPAAQWTVIIFMILAGANFAYFYLSVVRRRNFFLHSEEFRIYLLIITLATTAIVLNLLETDFYAGESLEYVIRQAAFQVVTIMTSTGFFSSDYELWPSFCRIVLFCLFFCGGCVGSTSGSIKVSRLIIVVKNCWVSLGKALQPKLISSIKLDKKIVPQQTINSVMVFVTIFFFLLGIGSLVLSALGLPPFEALSVSLASLSNVGPAFESFGPTCNYIGIPTLGKFFLAFLMMLGRLELMTVLVIFTKAFWRK